MALSDAVVPQAWEETIDRRGGAVTMGHGGTSPPGLAGEFRIPLSSIPTDCINTEPSSPVSSSSSSSSSSGPSWRHAKLVPLSSSPC